MSESAYKVVKHADGGLRSVLSWGITSYFVGEPTIRREGYGPYACFDTLEHASSCIRKQSWDIYNIKIFACNMKRSLERTLYTPFNSMERDFPEGILFADQVTLLDEIPLEAWRHVVASSS